MEAKTEILNIYGDMPKVRRLVSATMPEMVGVKTHGGQHLGSPEQTTEHTMFVVLQGPPPGRWRSASADSLRSFIEWQQQNRNRFVQRSLHHGACRPG